MFLCSMGMQEFDADREEIRVLDAYHGDRYLLASDGLIDWVEETRLQQIISHSSDPQQAAEMMTHEAIANGAGDDVTCVLLCVQADLNHELPTTTSPTVWQNTVWQPLKSWFKRA